MFDEDNQVSNGRALNMEDTMNQDAREWHPFATNPQQAPSCEIVPHEYSQEALGLSSEERRAQICAEQRARREAIIQRQKREQEEKRVTRDEGAHLAASVNSMPSSKTDPLYQYSASKDGSVEEPRCQRCRDTKKGCDRARQCSRCKDAGTGADSCVDWRPDSKRTGCH